MADSDIPKWLEGFTKSQQNFAKQFSAVSEKLANSSLDDFFNKLKKSTHLLELLGKSTLDEIKTSKELTTYLEKLQETYDELIKLDKKRIKLEEDSQTAVSLKEKRAIALEKRAIAAKEKELGISKDEADSVKKNIEAIKAEIDTRSKNISSYENIKKELDTFGGSIKSNVMGFFTLSQSVRLFKKSLDLAYEGANRLTNKGLLGSILVINEFAAKLQLLPAEFEEIVNANRELVAQLGGGQKGIIAFGKQLDEAKKGLEFLGLNGTKAAARFINSLSKIGITSKDGKAYEASLENMKRQYKEFSYISGDNYEEYTNLIESMETEENQRRKLNSLGKDELVLEKQEIAERAKNLRAMGLTSTELIDLHKRTQELFNPQKTDIAKNISEAYALRNFVNTIIKNTSDPNVKAELIKNKPAFDEYFQLASNPNIKNVRDKMMKLKSTDSYKGFATAFQKANGIALTGSAKDNIQLSAYKQQFGSIGGDFSTDSDKIANAIGKNIEKNSTVMVDAMKGAADSSDTLSEAFKKAAQAVGLYKTATENPLGTMVGAGLAGAAAVPLLMKLWTTMKASGALATATRLAAMSPAGRYASLAVLGGSLLLGSGKSKASTNPNPNSPSGSGASGSWGDETNSPAAGSISGINTSNYLSALGKRESSGRYEITGGAGGNYLGKYQMGALALQDAGLVKPGTSNRGLNDPSNWYLPGGKMAFLSSPSIQDKAVIDFTNKNHTELSRRGVINSSSSSSQIAGHLAASHLLGVNDYVKTGGKGVDGFGTSGTEYQNLGSNSQGGKSFADQELQKQTALLAKIADSTGNYGSLKNGKVSPYTPPRKTFAQQIEAPSG